MAQKMQMPDSLPNKYQKLLYLKKHKSFLKGLQYFFADSREKKFTVGNF